MCLCYDVCVNEGYDVYVGYDMFGGVMIVCGEGYDVCVGYDMCVCVMMCVGMICVCVL